MTQSTESGGRRAHEGRTWNCARQVCCRSLQIFVHFWFLSSERGLCLEIDKSLTKGVPHPSRRADTQQVPSSDEGIPPPVTPLYDPPKISGKLEHMNLLEGVYWSHVCGMAE